MAGALEQADVLTEGKHARKSPAVRLKLSVTENEAQPPQEVIKKVTKAHEIVEVEGFVFKRKRRIPLGESDNVQASAKKARSQEKADAVQSQEGESLKSGLPRRDAQCSSEAQRVAGWGGQGAVHAQLHKPAVSVVEAAQAALISLPQDCASEADRLLVLCEKLVEEELMSAEGEPNAQLLEKVLARFLGDVRASLGNGTLQCAEGAPAAAAAAERQRRLRAELEAQKAVLSVRLDRFLEEEAEWNELLEGGAAEEGITPADREGASDPASLGAAAAEGAADGEPVADGELHHVTRAAASSGAENPGVEPSVAGVLQQAQADAHRTLTMQVEGLCAMVEGVRELVATAEEITSAEFDKLYKENFSALPGLNSPARLIREIVRPPRSRLHTTSAGADAADAPPATPVTS